MTYTFGYTPVAVGVESASSEETILISASSQQLRTAMLPQGLLQVFVYVTDAAGASTFAAFGSNVTVFDPGSAPGCETKQLLCATLAFNETSKGSQSTGDVVATLQSTQAMATFLNMQPDVGGGVSDDAEALTDARERVFAVANAAAESVVTSVPTEETVRMATSALTSLASDATQLRASVVEQTQAVVLRILSTYAAPAGTNASSSASIVIGGGVSLRPETATAVLDLTDKLFAGITVNAEVRVQHIR